jgi:hypothetical protein
MHVKLIYSKDHQPINKVSANYFIFHIVPHCEATPVEFGSPHEAVCARFVD